MTTMLHHGGRLRAAAQRYGIPLADWLDLSTGIHPLGWSAPPIPGEVLRRLPEDEDELVAAACGYYAASRALPVAGSQAAIQMLPRLRARCRVGIVEPTYAEHARAWQQAGHQVESLSVEQVSARLPTLDVLVVVNPNNPTGARLSASRLLEWRDLLPVSGWLLVDEAFADAEVQADSLAAFTDRSGLIVLRSLGKFFGLAGLRAGFVLADAPLLDRLRDALGPWAVSHPTRWLATRALQDDRWQMQARHELALDRRRLQALLTQAGLPPAGGCALFQWVPTPHAIALHEALAQRGILTRLFTAPEGLRFGLPGAPAQWQRLQDTLTALMRERNG